MKKIIGFTLIELLIVMVIISIVAGVAVITLTSNQHKQYEIFANQLVQALQLAEQEAMLQSAVLGFAFTPHSFQFYTLQQNKKNRATTWTPIREGVLRAHPIPKTIQITLKINNEIIPANGQPKLIIPPGNDLTPFSILIGKPDETPYYQIQGKANGEVKSEIYAAE